MQGTQKFPILTSFRRAAMSAAALSIVLGAAAALAGSDASAAAGSTASQPAQAQALAQRLQTQFPGKSVRDVKATPYGFYQALIGTELIYTDAQADWVMEGQLLDIKNRRNLTQEAMQSIGDRQFDKLPLNLAIKQVHGDGERRVAIFEDPNCGYCKQLRHTLQKVDNLTIYTFLYPILAPDSAQKVKDIYCSPNPGQAWDTWMLDGKLPASGNCDVPTAKVLALGQELLVRGTPTLYFEDGTHMSGAIPLEALEKKLQESFAQYTALQEVRRAAANAGGSPAGLPVD